MSRYSGILRAVIFQAAPFLSDLTVIYRAVFGLNNSKPIPRLAPGEGQFVNRWPFRRESGSLVFFIRRRWERRRGCLVGMVDYVPKSERTRRYLISNKINERFMHCSTYKCCYEELAHWPYF